MLSTLGLKGRPRLYSVDIMLELTVIGWDYIDGLCTPYILESYNPELGRIDWAAGLKSDETLGCLTRYEVLGIFAGGTPGLIGLSRLFDLIWLLMISLLTKDDR